VAGNRLDWTAAQLAESLLQQIVKIGGLSIER